MTAGVKTLPERTRAYMARQVKVVDACLDTLLPGEDVYPEALHKAMRYSLFAGGKRLRPVLFLAACDLCGNAGDLHMPAACTLEMIHTYSLIHDDLPAMDDDDLRRGQPTNHKVFGEAVAILAGDALLTLAFEVLAVHEDDPSVTRALVRELGHGAGMSGMVGGQAADMDMEGGQGTPERLEYIHEHKTAKLIMAALRMGAVAGGGQDEDVAAMGVYGKNLGLAFQIQDDILDIQSSAEELGKTPGKDQAAGKLTYPALYGLENAQEKACALIHEAKQALAAFGDRAEVLLDLADFVIARTA